MSRDTATGWTYSEYARLPDDGQHYEVIDGEVCVTPAPGTRHQKIAANLYIILDAYVRKHALGEMFWDVDVLFVSGQYLRPDMVLVAAENLEGISDRGVEVAPRLIVEVLSPHSRHIDRIKKPPRYRDFGVPEYWVVDPEGRVIEAYALGEGLVTPQVHSDTLVFQPDRAKPTLTIQVADLFDS
ncbi:MAG: Uma2 family endonuclease [Gemmatimonadota bacterium]